MLSWGTSLPEVQAQLGSARVSILQRQKPEAGAGGGDGSLGVGCYLWPSSVVLARYVFTVSQLVKASGDANFYFVNYKKNMLLTETILVDFMCFKDWF